MLKGGLGRAFRSKIIGQVEGYGKLLRLKMAAKMRPDSGTGKDSVSERIVAGWI
jgi:hypothetical protein